VDDNININPSLPPDEVIDEHHGIVTVLAKCQAIYMFDPVSTITAYP